MVTVPSERAKLPGEPESRNYRGSVVVPPQIPGLLGWRALARGGFATVWEAKQLSLNRLVAVKVDGRTLTSDTDQRRFLRESGAAGRMSGHPGIVTVYDAGILTDDRPYLVMALCEGGSLTKWVKGAPKPTREQVREVGVRIADALAATHAAGVLHRDVKPANILMDSYGNAGLADFGLAALPDPGMELSQTLEAITPAYAPPEVFHRQPPTEGGDVYSLGASLYAMLAGRPPRWPESGTPNIVDMFERLHDPIERIPGVEDELMDLLLAAMVYEAADRPTAADFRDRLAELTLAPEAPPATNGSTAAPGPANGAGVAVEARAGGARKSSRAAGKAAAEKGVPAGPVEEADPLLPFPLAEQLTTHPTADRPTTDPPRTEEDRRRPRRALILVAAIVALLGLTLAALLGGLLPQRVEVAPGGSPASPSVVAQPSASPSLAQTPTPTPAPRPTGAVGRVPDNFRDCAELLGADTYCAPEPECWGGIEAFAGSPRQLERLDCDELHRFQTFAAGPLDFVPLRQADTDEVPAVQELCRRSVLDKMLVNPANRGLDLEVKAVGPQARGEGIFRCVVGGDERYAPLGLKKP